MTIRASLAKALLPTLFAALMTVLASGPASAGAITIVALGASNTYGKGVARSQSYPAQLEAMLRAKGFDVRVLNAGVNGDTTGGMLNRLDRAVAPGTRVVILQPGGNDGRKGVGEQVEGNLAAINSRLSARGIKVIMAANSLNRGLPHQADGQHLTAEGYRMLATALLPEVESSIRPSNP
jgi:acyl-CoA thioesterase-1